jgi:transcriptional regulator with XRE-family HTH domain
LRIEDLAARSGVSRAMISRIERGEAGASLGTLEKISIGLGVLLPELLGPECYCEPRLHQRNPVVSQKGQPEWIDSVCGYRRRTLTPATAEQPLQLFEMCLPGKARIALENPVRGARVVHQIWMLEGGVELEMDLVERCGPGAKSCTEVVLLRTGDCLAVEVGWPRNIHNAGSSEARWLWAVGDVPASGGAVSARPAPG